mgnify:CR=1 FL=1
MKKTLSIVLALVLALAALTGCGSAASTPAATEAPAAADTAADTASDAAEAPAELEVIKVGATATPHGQILESIKDALAAEGYELDIFIYDDYVLPNKALADGELDANYFQHRPYLNSYNEQNGTDLVSAAVIHYEPFGIYSNGVASLADLAEGATILIPADDSNGTRALLLLQQEGLIELPEGSSLDSSLTTLDVVDDHGYVITPVQADLIPSQLKNSDEGTIAIINGNYALAAGYTSDDALAYESTDSEATETYANVVAVRSGDENSAKIQALVKALQTDAVKQFINDTYKGSVVAYF